MLPGPALLPGLQAGARAQGQVLARWIFPQNTSSMEPGSPHQGKAASPSSLHQSPRQTWRGSRKRAKIQLISQHLWNLDFSKWRGKGERPLTQLETLRAAKEPSSSFSSSPLLGNRLSSRVVSHPQLTPAFLLGWPQDPVQVQKPRAEGPPKSKSCSHWETVWATTDGAQVPRPALGLGEEFEQTLATCCPLEARGADRE